MKTLTLLAVLCFAINASQVPNKAATKADNTSHGEGTPSVAVINNCSPGYRAQQEPECSPRGSTSVWANIPNWLLVAVGVITFFAVWKQAVETRKAAEATEASAAAIQAQTPSLGKAAEAAEKSAKAAEASIQALKEIERTWLVEKRPATDRIPRRSENPFGGVWVVPMTLTNIGKRPALVRMIQWRFHTAEAALPASPQYGPFGTVFLSGRLLAPDEPLYWRCTLEEGSLDDEQVNRVEGNGRLLNLYLYGRVEYESAGLIGVDQFCYKWDNLMGGSLEGDKQGFRKNGPDGYNKHT